MAVVVAGVAYPAAAMGGVVVGADVERAVVAEAKRDRQIRPFSETELSDMTYFARRPRDFDAPPHRNTGSNATHPPRTRPQARST